MSTAISDLVISIAGDIASLRQSCDQMVGAVEDMAGKIDGLAGKAQKALVGIAAGIASIATIKSFEQSIENAIEYAASLDKVARQSGTTASALSGLVAVGKLSHTTAEEIAGGLQKVQKQMVDVASGGGKAQLAFKALGLDVRDANGNLKDADGFILEVANKLTNLDSKTQQVAYAMQIFGKSGANLIPFLQDLAEKGEIVGKITDEQAHAAHEYMKTLMALETAKKSLYQTIAQQLLPILQAVAEMFLGSRTKADGLYGTIKALGADNTLRRWATDVAIGMSMVVDGLRYVVFGIGQVGSLIGTMGILAVEAFQGIATAITLTLDGLESFGLILTGIGQILSGQYGLGIASIKQGLKEISGTGGALATEFNGVMGRMREAGDQFFNDFEGAAGKFANGSVTEAFLGKMDEIGQRHGQVAKAGEVHADVIKTQVIDAYDKLLDRLAKTEAKLGVELSYLQKYGIETRATTEATVRAELATAKMAEALKDRAAREHTTVEALKEAAIEEAKRVDGLLISIDTWKSYTAAVNKHNEAMASQLQGVATQIERLQDEINTFGMGAQAVTAYAVAKLEANRAAALLMEGSEKEVEQLDRMIAKLQQVGSMQGQLQFLRDQAAAWSQVADAAGAFFSDLALNGDSAFKHLEESAKRFMAELIGLFAKRLILQLAADITGNSGLSLAASTSGNGTVAGSVLNYASSLYSAYQTYGTIAGTGGFLGNLASGYAGYQGSTGVFASQGTWGGAVGEALGTPTGGAGSMTWGAVGGIIAAIVVGMLANDHMFQSGWRTDNQDTTERVGGSLGTVHLADSLLRGLGFNDRWASLLSGSSLSARFWGRGPEHADAQGVMGSILGSAVTGQNWQDMSRRGGVFRSDERWTEKLPFEAGQTEFFNSIMSALNSTLGVFAHAAGVDQSAVLAGYHRDFNFQTTSDGKPISDAEMQRLIGDFFGTVLQEQTAQLFTAGGNTRLAEYVTNMKGTSDQIVGMIEELAGIIQAIPDLHMKGLSADVLLDWAQGTETLGQTFQRVAGQLAQFDDAFMSGEQKWSAAQALVTSTFDKLGIAVPENTQSFYDLVHGLDLSTKAGRDMFDTLMAIAPTFLSVKNAAESMMNSFDQLMGAMRPGYTAQRNDLQLSSWVAQFQAGNAWSAGMTQEDFLTQLRTITREDFSHYDPKWQTLILNILGLDHTMHDSAAAITQAVLYAASSASSGPSTGYGAIADGLVGHVDTLIGGATGSGSTLSKLITQKGIIDEEWGKMYARVQALEAPTGPGGMQLFNSTQALRDEYIGLQEAMQRLGVRMHGPGGILDDITHLSDLMGQYGTKTGEAIFALDEWYEAQKKIVGDNATALAALAAQYSEQLAAILDQATTEVDNARSQLEAWRNGLLVSGLSTLTPTQKLDELRDQYLNVLHAAQGGDSTAIGNLSGAAEAYLKLAQQMFGSSAFYQGILDQILADTGDIVGTHTPTAQESYYAAAMNALPSDGESLASEAGQMRLAEAVAELTALISAGISTRDSAVASKIEDLALELMTGNRSGALT
jgi:hypothetical protein